MLIFSVAYILKAYHHTFNIFSLVSPNSVIHALCASRCPAIRIVRLTMPDYTHCAPHDARLYSSCASRCPTIRIVRLTIPDYTHCAPYDARFYALCSPRFPAILSYTQKCAPTSCVNPVHLPHRSVKDDLQDRAAAVHGTSQ